MIAPDLFKCAMRQHAASVVVIGVGLGDRIHCMTATSFTAVSLEPPLVLFCVGRDNATHDLIAIEQAVGVSLLATGQEVLSRRFASKGPDRYAIEDLSLETTPGGAPVCPDACAALELRVAARHWGGDHSIFLGEVTWADVRANRPPLVYHAGQYGSVASTQPMAWKVASLR